MPKSQANLAQLIGRYYHAAIGQMEIIQKGDTLMISLDGVPPGYEIPLIMNSAGTWMLGNSMMRGLPIEFKFGDANHAVGFKLAAFDYTRLAADQHPLVPKRTLPNLVLEQEIRIAFENLYQQAFLAGSKHTIEYQLPYPKSDFLRYVARKHQLVFHGSTNSDIDQFQPVRTSAELFDDTGRGNLAAVYATHYPIWSMFFAIVDRSKARGAITNGVIQVQNGFGEKLDFYFFAMTEGLFNADPWVDGMIYILPSKTFRQLNLPNGMPSNEWASEKPVQPLMRIPVSPKDFPFLESVGVYRSPILERIDVLNDQISTLIASATVKENSIMLKLVWNNSIHELLEEYATLMGELFPQLKIEISTLYSESPVQIVYQGPPAVMQVLKQRLAKEGHISENW